MRTARLFILFCAAGLAGCSPLQLLSAVSGSSDYERIADQSYGDESRHGLDVYVPVKAQPDAPLVVYFYGRAWRDGDKAEFRFIASSLTNAGFVVVLPDYRLYPDVLFPSYVEDGARAVTWALQNAARFGADDRKVYLMGHSAGAQIAALLAYDHRYLRAAGIESPQIAGFIGLSGPYDFLPLGSGYLLKLFPDELRADSQAINFVSAESPPTLLIHGGDDDLVEPGNSERLAARLRAAGVPVTLHNYAGVGHGRVVVALAPPLDFIAATLEDTIAFILENEKRPIAVSQP